MKDVNISIRMPNYKYTKDEFEEILNRFTFLSNKITPGIFTNQWFIDLLTSIYETILKYYDDFQILFTLNSEDLEMLMVFVKDKRNPKFSSLKSELDLLNDKYTKMRLMYVIYPASDELYEKVKSKELFNNLM